MIKPIMYQQVKKLKEVGHTWTTIASITGLDIKTVKKYDRMSLEEYQNYYTAYRQRVKCFDVYESEIVEICINANSSKVNSSSVYDLLEERHGVLAASERSFRNYMAYLRANGKLQQKQGRIYDPVEPMPPGKQMQLDFGEYRMKDGKKYYIFAAILSASRYRYVRLYDRPLKTRDLIDGLSDCFSYYGGMPHEIAIDQDHLMVVDENKGDVILTHDFSMFRDEMGFDLYVCRKSDPESKGKVENLVNFVKRSFLTTRSFADLQEAKERLSKWLVRRANGKKSAATGRKPVDYMEDERKHLKPLKNSIFAMADKNLRELRKVDKLGQISIHGAKLRVPHEYCSKKVSVFISADEVHVFDAANDNKIAIYTLKTGVAKIPIIRQKSLRQGKYAELKKTLLGRFQFQEWNLFVEANFQTYRRYFVDQYNDFQKKFPTDPEMGQFKESLKYCVDNKTVSMSQLYDTYTYLMHGNSLKKEAQSMEYNLLNNSHYQSPIVAKREINSYMELANSDTRNEVSA